MRIRLTAVAPLSLLLSFAACAVAQIPAGITPPPIRMGLWQSTVSMQSGAMGPGRGGAPSTHQSCMTPDSWKDAMQKMQSRQQQQANCTTSNLQQDSHKISFDGQCSVEQGYNVTYHVEMFLDGDTAMHGTSTARMSGPMFPQPMTMSSTISSKWLSAECGDVKPGESKPLHP